MAMIEAVVCASCPEAHQDHVATICKALGFQKAFGKAGDMVDSLKGKDWVAKWEAKVVMATVTKAETLGVSKAKILCISGGRHCDLEMARQPALVRAIKQEMNVPDFRVKVEWMEYDDFVESYGGNNGASPATYSKGEESNPSHLKSKSGKGKGKGKMDTVASKPNKEVDDCLPGERQTEKAQGAGKQGKGKANPKQTDAVPSKGKGKPEKVDTLPSKGKGKPEKVACKAEDTRESRPGQGNGAKDSNSKTQMCKYFLQGYCQNGSSCKYLHSLTESRGAFSDSSKGRGKIKGQDKINLGPKQETFTCKACSRTFVNEHALQQHWESKPECNVEAHDGVYEIGPCVCRCRVCDREFESESALSQHLRSSGHGEMLGGPLADQTLAKQLDHRFADQLRSELHSLKEMVGIAGMLNHSKPQDLIGAAQRALDTSCAILFEWACFLRKHGADFDLNAGFIRGSCEECDSGYSECLLHPRGDACSKCGQPRKILRFCAPRNVPNKTKESASQLDREFCEAIAHIGFSPTTACMGGPMAAVACGAMCSFLSSYGGSDTPRLLQGVPSRVPAKGPLRELDNRAFECLCSSSSAARSRPESPIPFLESPIPFLDLMKLSVKDLKQLLVNAGLDAAAEQAVIERQGIVDKSDLASYVDCRLAETVGSPSSVDCALCARRFPDKACLEHHKEYDHGRLLNYLQV